ncbi:hypothetical protein phiAS5_ORF0260 [Aeromonas phage phiAS5]|uniref:Uncharacterized protein n=1 Tax=Aeromonas phage phiAS5 TaxID=879630 RepID=E1A214_9CAUD|nr:hypothetical protein phiAS5_ORF0260 [Aeromonas phage phiAS5]ADM80103.1 hypothetical protein phiAS5_ORF0260 [Aeromonas phage phiAS5]BES53134.1 hypothetical protein [Aeromonas phage phiWae14]
MALFIISLSILSCIAVVVGLFIGIDQYRTKKRKRRVNWVLEHYREVREVLQEKGIRLEMYNNGIITDFAGAASWFRFIDNVEGAQTRNLTIHEFYDLMMQVQGTNNIRKYLFAQRYIYRRFNVK